MKQEWFTAEELAKAQLPDLPRALGALENKLRSLRRLCPSLARQEPGKTKPVWTYHVNILPPVSRQKLAFVAATIKDAEQQSDRHRELLWTRFKALSKDHQAICRERLDVLDMVDAMVKAGAKGNEVKRALQSAGIGRATYYDWRKMCEGFSREDWLAALAPSFSPAVNGVERERADCHPDAWSYLKSDFLRSDKPAFSACYRRMENEAKKQGWAPIPAERTLRRRLDTEVPRSVQVMARSGKEEAKKLFPAQRRSRAHLHAMQMVNMDGHKLDVFVKVPWCDTAVRLFLLGIQDLYSGKIVAWRLCEAETWEAVRLVIGDMVEHYGIPDDIYLDNGRAFASKWISGGTRTRFRFKVREEDPAGLLLTLGINAHFTTPYAGQSKPIERAWRDLAEAISKHPAMAGAYTGNRPDAKPDDYGTRAVPLDEFREHVAARVDEHNAQTGRKAANCRGRSFDETFAASIETAIVRWPTAAQKALWLLASEKIRARKGSGEIHFQGNRYWSPALNQWAGKQVTIRFDPDALHEPVKVYDLENRLICEAACIADTGFDNRDEARHHARKRRDYMKAVQAEKTAHAALSAAELGALAMKGRKAKTPQAEPRPVVTRLATAAAARRAPAPAQEIDVESVFSRAMARISGGSVIPFPKGE